MRKAGRVVAEMLEVTSAAARPGTTTSQLDKLARGVLERRGPAPTSLVTTVSRPSFARRPTT